MKVFLALFVPLLASLLLPSEVKGRRRVRGEDEYEVSYVRKRAMRFKEYFNGDNLQKTCSLCHKHYDIDEANCIASKQRAKLNCVLKVRDNRANFETLWAEAISSAPTQPVSNKVPTGDEYFLPENMEKTCRVCSDLFQINSADCSADQNGAKQKCKDMVNEMPNAVGKKWKNLPMNEVEVRRVMKRSIAVQDESKGENLEKICLICHKYFGIDEASCIKNTQKVTDECKQKVKESQTFLDSKWIKSYSPAAGQPSDAVDFSGTKESIQQMCSICDQLFHFSSSDCVADKTGIRQKCQNWINEYKKLIKRTENQQIVAPGSAEIDSAALKFSNAEN